VARAIWQGDARRREGFEVEQWAAVLRSRRQFCIRCLLAKQSWNKLALWKNAPRLEQRSKGFALAKEQVGCENSQELRSLCIGSPMTPARNLWPPPCNCLPAFDSASLLFRLLLFVYERCLPHFSGPRRRIEGEFMGYFELASSAGDFSLTHRR